MVLCVALTLVVVITGLRPHLVPGAGQAAPVTGPPVVGDCVVDPLPAPTLMSPNVPAGSGGTVPVYPAQQIQPCTAARYGEVVAVIGKPGPTVLKGDDANGRYLDDPNEDSCYTAAFGYLGMTTKPLLSYWQTYLLISVAVSRPSLRQHAAGQRWAACIVALPAPDPGPEPTSRTPAAPQYVGSIRDALHTGQERDQLGICLTTVDWLSGFTVGACGKPHAVELLASGDSGDRPVPRERIQATCQQMVGQLTAMADPTASGALSAQVHITDRNSSTPIITPQIPAHSVLQCGVVATGTRKLAGSLIALGTRPIPWTS